MTVIETRASDVAPTGDVAGQADEILTTAQAAALLGVCENTLLKIRKTGQLSRVEQEPAKGAAKPYRVLSRRAEVEAFRALQPPHPPPSDFMRTLKAALKRSGMTFKTAARTSGFSPAALSSWGACRRTPFRDNLERLAETLSEPRLVDLIDSQRR